MSVAEGVRTLGKSAGANLSLSGKHFAVFKLKMVYVPIFLRGASSAFREKT